jgi:hypothetical protein
VKILICSYIDRDAENEKDKEWKRRKPTLETLRVHNRLTQSQLWAQDSQSDMSTPATLKSSSNSKNLAVMPFHSIPCRAVPCRAVPCRAVPCHAMPRHGMLSPSSCVDTRQKVQLEWLLPVQACEGEYQTLFRLDEPGRLNVPVSARKHRVTISYNVRYTHLLPCWCFEEEGNKSNEGKKKGHKGHDHPTQRSMHAQDCFDCHEQSAEKEYNPAREGMPYWIALQE